MNWRTVEPFHYQSLYSHVNSMFLYSIFFLRSIIDWTCSLIHDDYYHYYHYDDNEYGQLYDLDSSIKLNSTIAIESRLSHSLVPCFPIISSKHQILLFYSIICMMMMMQVSNTNGRFSFCFLGTHARPIDWLDTHTYIQLQMYMFKVDPITNDP